MDGCTGVVQTATGWMSFLLSKIDQSQDKPRVTMLPRRASNSERYDAKWEKPGLLGRDRASSRTF